MKRNKSIRAMARKLPDTNKNPDSFTEEEWNSATDFVTELLKQGYFNYDVGTDEVTITKKGKKLMERFQEQMDKLKLDIIKTVRYFHYEYDDLLLDDECDSDELLSKVNEIYNECMELKREIHRLAFSKEEKEMLCRIIDVENERLFFVKRHQKHLKAKQKEKI